MTTKGWGSPEVERTYIRARELCQNVADPLQIFTVLWGLWIFYHVSGQFKQSKKIANEILILAKQQSDSGLLLQAHHAAWTTDYFYGNLANEVWDWLKETFPNKGYIIDKKN